jgi:glucose-1-phosphate cytidylyltransferase
MRPKPMVEIGGIPMLRHIMNIYSCHGFDDFIICTGYRGEVIWEYFHEHRPERGKVEIIDTGLDTPTGGRLHQVRHLLGPGPFMLTYGDGVADVDIRALAEFHRSRGELATVTAVRPPARFGSLDLQGTRVRKFSEKPANEGWISGGFFVMEPGVFRFIRPDQMLEFGPLADLAEQGHLVAYRHEGFWQCMDTIRDRERLEELWKNGAPWVINSR